MLYLVISTGTGISLNLIRNTYRQFGNVNTKIILKHNYNLVLSLQESEATTFVPLVEDDLIIESAHSQVPVPVYGSWVIIF